MKQLKKDDILIARVYIAYSGREYIDFYQVIKSTQKTVWLRELKRNELNCFFSDDEVLQRRIQNNIIKVNGNTTIKLT